MAPAPSDAPIDDAVGFDENEAFSLLNTAYLLAGETLTAPGLTPRERLATLIECHGDAMAALGPGANLAFGEFRAKLRGPIGDLLPAWISADGLEDVSVLDADGYVTEDAFDLRWENAELLRLIRKLRDFSGRRVSADKLYEHRAQEEVFAAISGRGEQHYVHDRTHIITRPVGKVDDLADLGLPLKAVAFYTDISYQSTYRGWWFPCPVCQWPMKVSQHQTAGTGYGQAECFYPRHAETGASYMFHPTDGTAPVLHPAGDVPDPSDREKALYLSAGGEPPAALPAAGYKALTRGVWRYTTVPGLAELRLHQQLQDRLAGTGATVRLWPMNDAYDHQIEVPQGDGQKLVFTADLKDYTHGHTLGKTIHQARGDRGGAKWLVAPDHRAGQVPLLLGVCRKYGMNALTATDFAVMVCEAAGVAW